MFEYFKVKEKIIRQLCCDSFKIFVAKIDLRVCHDSPTVLITKVKSHIAFTFAFILTLTSLFCKATAL